MIKEAKLKIKVRKYLISSKSDKFNYSNIFTYCPDFSAILQSVLQGKLAISKN